VERNRKAGQNLPRIVAPIEEEEDVFSLIILTTVTLTSSNSALPDDGDYTETS
jgi:hypothetical protein